MLRRTSFAFLVLGCLLVGNTLAAQRFSTVDHLGREHIQVVTKAATYLYDPVAGGFSSIIDPKGNDWVAYRDEPWGKYPASAASSYRGVPNLVFGGEDNGAGHPGHKQCQSRVIGKRIVTTTNSGDWGWAWTFGRRGARLDVTRTPQDRAYWFLFEGPAGGSYSPKETFWATDLTDPSYAIPDHYAGKTHRAYYQIMYFGTQNSPYVIAMLQIEADTKRDHISYLGNEEIGAADSPDGMLVAGFGRDEGATPLLTGRQSFYLAIMPRSKPNRIRRRLRRLAK